MVNLPSSESEKPGGSLQRFVAGKQVLLFKLHVKDRKITSANLIFHVLFCCVLNLLCTILYSPCLLYASSIFQTLLETIISNFFIISLLFVNSSERVVWKSVSVTLPYCKKSILLKSHVYSVARGSFLAVMQRYCHYFLK